MLRAIILAAGQGTRLRPYTDATPKCLIPVGGRPILHYQLEAFRGRGIKEVVIVVGYQKEAVINYVKNTFRSMRVRFVENPRFAVSNTLHSFALAASAAPSGSVLQLNGDVVFDAEILDKLLHAGTADCYIALRAGECAEEEVKVKIDEGGAVYQLNKQVSARDAVGEAVGINFYRGDFWPALMRQLGTLRDSHANDYFEYAVEQTIAAGKKAYPVNIGESRAIEVDFPEDLTRARTIFSSSVHAPDG